MSVAPNPRFLSIDPVAVDTKTAWNFCCHCYAANNPYKFKDPDGRIIDTIADIGFIAYDLYSLAIEPSWTNAGALGADIVGAVVPFATGLGASVRAAEKGVEVARTADAAKTSANVAESAPAPGRTDFIVDSSGQAFPVPKGATGPTPVINPAWKQTGVAYTGGKEGSQWSSRHFAKHGSDAAARK